MAPGAPFAIGEEAVRGVPMPVFAHRPRSLTEILDASVHFADRTYVVDGDVRIDFATHREWVDRLAAALRERSGVAPGDRVALFGANSWQWIVAFWATAAAGAIPCAFNGWWTADETAHAVGVVEPVLVIGDATRRARADAAGVAVPWLDVTEIPDLVATAAGTVPRPVVAEDDPALCIFTSGTTGRPKAVTISHRGLCGALQSSGFAESVARVALGAPVPAVGDPPVAADDVILVTSPLFHTSMLFGVVQRCVTRGSGLVLLSGRFDPERVLRTIGAERVTTWLALGSAGPRVAAVPDLDRFDTSSLRQLGVGGAPVSPAVQDQLRAAFPQAGRGLSMGYASTESVSVVASIAGADFVAHPTSTGRVIPTVTVELRDDHGDAVPDGTPGEVHVRSPYVMLGYWNDPEASAAVLKPGGWLAMGDVGRIEDGLLFIDSRARDLILVNAENVTPSEVEYRLEAHPAVLEAAVFAVDDPVTGDAVHAAVVVGVGASVTEADLATWCAETLAYYKVPTRWSLGTEPLARTASGKLMKDRIRAQVAGGPA